MRQFELSVNHVFDRFQAWSRSVTQDDRSDSGKWSLEFDSILREASPLREELQRLQSGSGTLTNSDKTELDTYIVWLKRQPRGDFFYKYVLGQYIAEAKDLGALGNRREVEDFIRGKTTKLRGYDPRPRNVK
jgi:hypothetical protein